MARKKKKKSSKELVNPDATIKKLTSQLVDPRVQQWLWHGANGVRERVLQMNFDTLRRVTGKLPLINGIINARIDQVLPFTKFATEKGDRGFKFEIEDRTDEFRGSDIDDAEVLQLATFLEQTGFHYDSDREDDLADYVSMMIRDIYEIDQIATEVQKNRLGEVVSFWALDGATIFRVSDEARFKRGIRFVQMIEEKIYEEYTNEDLIFDYKYKRTDMKHRGYGYSPVEQCIDIITTLLFGYNYIRDQLIKDKMPKGFISVMGDIGTSEMDAIRNYWYAAMSGAGAKWTIPILPSGKDGVGMDFKNLGQNNRDMEYHKTMMFVSSLVAAVFGMDLAELGIKTDDSTALIGENLEPRIQHSKDRGLTSMLSFIEQHINKVIRKSTQKYRFRFVGIEREDQQKKAEIRNKQIVGWKSIDEIREEDELKPFDEDWSKMPLNPQAVQIFLGAKQQEAQEKMMSEGGGGIEEGPEEEAGQDEDLFANANRGMRKSLSDFQKLTDKKERTVKIVIE
jgi:hypothetical protein